MSLLDEFPPTLHKNLSSRRSQSEQKQTPHHTKENFCKRLGKEMLPTVHSVFTGIGRRLHKLAKLVSYPFG
jgi:hypothetical protein